MFKKNLSLFLNKAKRTLFGDLSVDEFRRFTLLGVILMLIIGTYWLMRPLRDSIFLKMVGPSYLHYAQLFSAIITIPLVLGYSKLVDLLEKQKLFYIIFAFFSCCFILFGLLLAHPTIGTSNTVPHSSRLLGWFLYFSIDSFGILAINHFWSFVNSSTDVNAAKRGYGLIIFLTQIGTISGPLLAAQAPTLGLWSLIVTSGLLLATIPFFINFFIKQYPSSAETEHSFEKKKKTGSFAGLTLIFKNPYLIGVLGVATLHDIVGVSLELQMKYLANNAISSPEQLSQFLGYYGVALNSLTLLLSLFGTSLFLRRFGIRFCLALFPIASSFFIFNTWVFPTLLMVTGAVIVHKCLSYAINNPCKEILYLPTSKDVKFKAKSWIDMFGVRCAKAFGAQISGALYMQSLATLMFYGPFITLGISCVWLSSAIFVGRKNKKLIDSGKIIE